MAWLPPSPRSIRKVQHVRFLSATTTAPGLRRLNAIYQAYQFQRVGPYSNRFEGRLVGGLEASAWSCTSRQDHADRPSLYLTIEHSACSSRRDPRFDDALD